MAQINIMETKGEYKILPRDVLIPNPIREIRKSALEKIKQRILADGFNPAKPLSVKAIFQDGKTKYLICDGNHRFKVCKELNIKKIPCFVYDNHVNEVKIAVRCNQDEDTYAPNDLFDFLSIIDNLRKQGKTQKEIAEELGWSREKVKDYSRVISHVGAEILDFAKKYQIGRAPQDGANAPTFNFTEGWFRDSGIYDLPPHRQMELLKWFIEEKKCKVNGKSKIREYAQKLKEKEEWIQYVKENLLDKEKLNEFIEYIENSSFSNFESVKKAVEFENGKFLKTQQVKVIHGDFREVGKEIEDESIDLIITDPPYGKEYLPLWDDLGKLAKRVLKPGGFLVAYSGQYHILEVLDMLKKHLSYYWILAVQHTGSTHIINHKNIMSYWKPILVFYKEPLQKLKTFPDFIRGEKDKKYHEWGQSVSEVRKLIKYFSNYGDIILDPFSGSGTTLIGALLEERRAIGIEIEEKYVKIIKGRLQEYASHKATL